MPLVEGTKVVVAVCVGVAVAEKLTEAVVVCVGVTVQVAVPEAVGVAPVEREGEAVWLRVPVRVPVRVIVPLAVIVGDRVFVGVNVRDAL